MTEERLREGVEEAPEEDEAEVPARREGSASCLSSGVGKVPSCGL